MLIDENNKQAIKAIEIAIQIIENYPAFSTTFSQCSECKRNSAKGGMLCTSCLEDELAEIVGCQKAKEFHDNVKIISGRMVN